MSTITSAVTFSNNSAYPITFERLRPGSFFRITSEPSRNLPRVRDGRIYRKDKDGFFAENISNHAGCVLMPNDLVMPLRKEKSK